MRGTPHLALYSQIFALWAVLALPAAQPELPLPWKAPLGDAAWTAQPSWLANPAASGTFSASVAEAVTSLRVTAPQRGMKWTWNLPTPVPLAGRHYVAMRYRARGISPQGHYALCFLGTTPSGSIDYQVAVAPSELRADGRWRTATASLESVAAKLPSLTGLACEVQALSADAQLELQDVRLTEQLPAVPLSDLCSWRPGADFAGFRPLPLPAGAITNGADWLQRLRLTNWPQTNLITVEAVPFELARGELRFAATPLEKKADLHVPVGCHASELLLFLLAEFQGPEEAAYGEGRFSTIHDVDRFRVRLEYTDGTADEMLPLDAGSRQFGVTGEAQVLVAAADFAKVVKEVVVRDLTRQAAFAVAAVSARVERKRAFPEALEQTPPLALAPKRHKPSAAQSGLKLAGHNLQVTCGACRAVIGFEGQPRWRQLEDLATHWKMLTHESPLVELTVDGKPISPGAYSLRSLSAADHGSSGGPQCAAQYDIGGAAGLTLSMTVGPSGSDGLAIQLAVTNAGSEPRRIALRGPRIGPYLLGAEANDSYYLFPKRGAAFDNRPCTYRERYCGLFPLQFIETLNSAASRGLTLRTEDTNCLWKHYVLEKNGSGLLMGLDYEERVLGAGERLQTPRTVLSLTDGSAGRGLASYRSWVSSWYQPLTPRKPWFRDVFNFRQRFLYWLDPLYDGQRLDLGRALDEGQREFGGVDYLHLFDWGNCEPYGRIYGRTGDYSPFDRLKGGEAALREAIAGVQAGGIPVGLYIEGYLLEERGKLGQQFGKDWQLIDPAGKGSRWPDSTELFTCSFVPQWREVQASTYAEKARELKPDGMYIDEYGFAGANVDCWSTAHGHGRPGYAVAGEQECTRLIRRSLEAAKPGVALYTEESPVDVVSQLQDGSFTYALSTARQTATLVPLNLVRFALPTFKTIEILYCDKPTGSWATGVKWVFFNGEAIWLEGPAAEWFEPETREAIRRCHDILRRHRDAFRSDSPTPLLPTLQGGVFANAFPAAGKTVYTLYNSRHRTVRGDLLALPWEEGVSFEDAWHEKPAITRHVRGSAVISGQLGPNDVGCFVANHRPPQ
jgi:hypothetical protein